MQTIEQRAKSYIKDCELQGKLCRKCGEVKPIEEFGSDAQKYDGKCWWCKDCMRTSHLKSQELRKIGRNATLARFSDEELFNELKWRMLWHSTRK